MKEREQGVVIGASKSGCAQWIAALNPTAKNRQWWLSGDVMVIDGLFETTCVKYTYAEMQKLMASAYLE